MAAPRSGRSGDRILSILSQLIRDELRDPRVGFVTLTEVNITSDRKHARVFLSTLAEDPEPVLRGLRKAAPFLRRRLAQKGGLRFTPELTFVLDESVAGGFRVDQILNQVLPEDEAE